MAGVAMHHLAPTKAAVCPRGRADCHKESGSPGGSAEQLRLLCVELGLGEDTLLLQIRQLGELGRGVGGAGGLFDVLVHRLLLRLAASAARSCILPPRAIR